MTIKKGHNCVHCAKSVEKVGGKRFMQSWERNISSNKKARVACLLSYSQSCYSPISYFLQIKLHEMQDSEYQQKLIT